MNGCHGPTKPSTRSVLRLLSLCTTQENSQFPCAALSTCPHWRVVTSMKWDRERFAKHPKAARGIHNLGSEQSRSKGNARVDNEGTPNKRTLLRPEAQSVEELSTCSAFKYQYCHNQYCHRDTIQCAQPALARLTLHQLNSGNVHRDRRTCESR